MKKEKISLIFFSMLLISLSSVLATTTINSCQDFNTANKYYILNESVTRTADDYCFEFKANNVTLDCNASNIDGGTSNEMLIVNNNGGDNITLKNCHINDSSSGLIFAYGNKDINITGLTSEESTHAIMVYNYDKVNIKDVDASGIITKGLYLTDSTNIQIENVTTRRIGSGVINEFINVSNVLIKGMNSNIRTEFDGGDNVTVRDSTFANHTYNIFVTEDSDIAPTNYSFINNTIYNATSDSEQNIELEGCDDCKIINNTIYDSEGYGLETEWFSTGGGYEYCDDIEIKGNTIYDFQKDGLLVYYVTNGNVTNNYIHHGNSTSWYGLKITNSDNVNVSNNNVTDSTSRGVLFGGNDVNSIFSDNNIINVTRQGIYMNDDNITIKNVCVNNTQDLDALNPGYSIYVSSGTYHTNIIDSVFENSHYGILIFDVSGLNITNTQTRNHNQDFSFGSSEISTCDNTFNNLTTTYGQKVMFYNYTTHISNWNNNFSILYFCDADNSTINNLTVRGNISYEKSVVFLRTINYTITNSSFHDNTSIELYQYKSGTTPNIYNNLFNNTHFDTYEEMNITYGTAMYSISFNTSKKSGSRIYGDGLYVGGNYWLGSYGYSESCTDDDRDGFCDNPYNISTNTSCVAGSSCSDLYVDYLAYSDEYSTIENINLLSPTNQSYMASLTPNFTFNVTGRNTTYNCDLIINSTLSGKNASINNNTLTRITSNRSLTNNGTYNWWINCTDAYGTIKSSERETYIDITSPTLTINNPAENYTNITSSNIYLNITTTDNLGVNKCFYNCINQTTNNSIQNGTFNCSGESIGMPLGFYDLNISVNDSAGNTNTSTVRNINLTTDTSPPTISITEPNGTKSSTTIQAIYSITDNVATNNCGYYVTFGDSTHIGNTTINCSETNTSFVVSGDGNFVFHLWANDTKGNIGQDNSSFTVSTSTTIVGGGGGSSDYDDETCGFEITRPAGAKKATNYCVPGENAKQLSFQVYNTIGENREFEFSIENASVVGCVIKPSTILSAGSSYSDFVLEDCICPEETEEFTVLIEQNDCNKRINVKFVPSKFLSILTDPGLILLWGFAFLGVIILIIIIFFYVVRGGMR